MGKDQIESTLTKGKFREILNAYKVLDDFLDSVLPKEDIYKTPFLRGVETALKEVESGQTKKVKSFDEFIE
jgi:hypothetical protein